MSELLRLIPRMVPAPLFGVCLRNDLGPKRWLEEVSRPIREAARSCEICGGVGTSAPSNWKLCCDEVWTCRSFPAPATATLTDLQSICWWCNGMIHFGHSLSTCSDGTLKDIFRHAVEVNDCHPRDLHAVIATQQQQWLEWSLIDGWQITWDGWQKLRDDKLSALMEGKRRRLPWNKAGA